jgi:large subunit ribosomal protein L21
MYAIIRSGGKQHRVEEGRALVVERLPEEAGSAVELNDVLLIEADGAVTVGTPTIEGARVIADIEAHGRAKKIIVFKYKSKVRARKKTGHRQSFTKLVVREILAPGQEATKEAPAKTSKDVKAEDIAIVEAPPKKPSRRTRKAVPVAEAEAEMAEVVAEAEAAMPEAAAEPVAEAAPAAKPKARSRAKPASKATDEKKPAEEKKPARRRPTLRRKKKEE